ncbi:hypothetical protein [Klebsiella phage phiKp_21]|uniref:Uncharacterized protein n=1 Tax=Klebsiella phage vB_KleM_RaK2 TaxID=1147094 RepID=H6X441_9CAUD|nr:hypothetical protein F403_gp301 [Klebsiella phage vB_KleM_RaK2]YP_010843178.1 hypothetical protein ACQ27_gp294 [Klebsiella phage K64-1]AFA44507.1 hypothetical protein RaK2_00234 [Klebsiella phage vB_KleM_RaK2]UYL05125.1 hypothetical protein DIDNDMLP_00140 [Klebsiella phage KP13-7]BEH88454.1 hypothetical protein [Klebsiella phage phiKp_21]
MLSTFKRVYLRNNKMQVRLHKDEADSFMAKAIVKSELYKRLSPKESSPYGFNHPHSHYVGLVCEHAAYVLFTELEEMTGIKYDIDPAFQNSKRDGECDLIVNNLRIEVKGIKYKSWTNYGPCISTRQLKNIEKKADIILWVLYNEKRHEFSFEGFNYVKDVHTVPVKITGAKGKPQIKNHPVIDIIKPLQELPI